MHLLLMLYVVVDCRISDADAFQGFLQIDPKGNGQVGNAIVDCVGNLPVHLPLFRLFQFLRGPFHVTSEGIRTDMGHGKHDDGREYDVWIHMITLL